MALLSVLGACAGGPSGPDPSRSYATVVWKQGVSASRRASDMGACELSTMGASGTEDQEQIIALSSQTAPREYIDRMSGCLRQRGYTITDLPICTPAERASGALQRITATDDLPPIDKVLCIEPNSYGFVLK